MTIRARLKTGKRKHRAQVQRQTREAMQRAVALARSGKCEKAAHLWERERYQPFWHADKRSQQIGVRTTARAQDRIKAVCPKVKF